MLTIGYINRVTTDRATGTRLHALQFDNGRYVPLCRVDDPGWRGTPSGIRTLGDVTCRNCNRALAACGAASRKHNHA